MLLRPHHFQQHTAHDRDINNLRHGRYIKAPYNAYIKAPYNEYIISKHHTTPTNAKRKKNHDKDEITQNRNMHGAQYKR